MSYWATELLNGLAFGMILYLVAVGLTVIMGVMRVVNLMHGSGYLLGAYVALTVIGLTHRFEAGALAAVAVAVPIALAVYLLLRRVGSDLTAQAVLTFAIVYVIADLTTHIFGAAPRTVPVPPALAGSVDVAGFLYPAYRLFLIGAGLLLAGVLSLVDRRTLYGALVRAVADDWDMVAALGRRPRLIAAGTFVVGVCLSFLGGALGGATFGTNPGADVQFLVFGLVVVVLGGMGSLAGSLVSAVLVGVVDSVSKAALPSLGDLSIFVLMIVVLALRPRGLFGAREPR
jgi:branched-chain amino acid transport system permease protein